MSKENKCTKKGYDTYTMAIDALRSLNEMNRRGSELKSSFKLTSVYRCVLCNKWHLTSMEQKHYKGKRK